jgi:hypothetical protein
VYAALGLKFSPDATSSQANLPLEAFAIAGVRFTWCTQDTNEVVCTGYGTPHAVYSAPGSKKIAV